jgi:hypothetical protein
MKNELKFLPALGVFLAMVSSNAHAQNLNDIENRDAESSVLLDSEEEGGACKDWLDETYQGDIEVGDNVKDDGSKFYIGIGKADVIVKTKHPNWINSRRNAYTKAMLDVKKNLVEELGLDISRNIMSDIAEGSPLFSTEERSAEERKNSKTDSSKTDSNETGTKFTGGPKTRNDTRDSSSAYLKVMELINRSLDKELKDTEPKKLPDDQKEAAEEVKKIVLDVVGEEIFEDVIKTSARAALVGVRRLYTNDSAPLNAKGSICVVAISSKKTEQIAAGMGLNDPSLLPVGEPGVPLRDMAPNRKTEEGVKELISTFGVDMMRDEDGDYVLMSYGQSGAKNRKKRSISIAKKKAARIAQGQLRTFLGEIAIVKGSQSSSESLKDLADESEVYESEEKFQEQIKSVSATLKMKGMKKLYDWAGIHPATEQIVAGSVYYLSSKSLQGAITKKADMERVYNRTKSGNKGNLRGSNQRNEAAQRRKYNRGAGRGTSKKDF